MYSTVDSGLTIAQWCVLSACKRASVFWADVTGVDQLYDVPLKPDLVLCAGELSLDECAQQLVSYLQQRVTGLSLASFYN